MLPEGVEQWNATILKQCTSVVAARSPSGSTLRVSLSVPGWGYRNCHGIKLGLTLLAHLRVASVSKFLALPLLMVLAPTPCAFTGGVNWFGNVYHCENLSL
jgi:hypothetical protein